MYIQAYMKYEHRAYIKQSRESRDSPVAKASKSSAEGSVIESRKKQRFFLPFDGSLGSVEGERGVDRPLAETRYSW